MVGRPRSTGLLGVVVKWDYKLQIRNNRWANENPMVGRSRPTVLLGVVVKWDYKLQICNNGWANGNPQQRATGGFHKYCIGKVMDGVVAFFVSLRCC